MTGLLRQSTAIYDSHSNVWKCALVKQDDGTIKQVGYGSTREEAEANSKLIAAAPDLLEAVKMITTNPHIFLGDLVYAVRDKEGKGWEGPAVEQWSKAVEKLEAAIKKATE